MSRARDAPSHRRYSNVRIEEAVITNVNRNTWTVTADTRHSNKTVEDIQCMVPYHHYEGGEGFHFLPEVGAICYLCWPADNTSPFILGYVGVAASQTSTDGAPARSTPDGSGSPTDVSFRSRRPDLQPGDLAITTRDENFIIARRGGVLQLGATSIAQRIYIPVLNYIKDFCENYEMHTFGGDVAWTVGRQEDDPGGDAPATYTLHMNEFAQDAKATVRIRHLPLTGPSGGDKVAWEIYVAPQNIDRDDGTVTDEVYSMLITVTGDQTELIGGARSVRVKGDDELLVDGKQTITVHGDAKLSADGDLEYIATGNAVVGGRQVRVGSRGAASPGVLGDQLLTVLPALQFIVGAGPAVGSAVTLNPASIPMLQQLLSTKVFIE